MNKLAHQTMKYIAAGVICIFFVLGAGIVKPVVEVDLPSSASVWMANLSTDILAAQQPAAACDSAESLFGDSYEDLDDAFVDMHSLQFFAWSGIAQDGSGNFLPILWRSLPKIPIVWSAMVYF